MPFVKLDCGILNSSIWPDKDARDIFITSLLMAEPHELTRDVAQLSVTEMSLTGWTVPAGWYGLVEAAGPGIAGRASIGWDRAMVALVRLGNPEPESRSQAHEGRRMVRIDGGYIILNYDRYREKDYGSAERMRRYRERHKVLRATVTGGDEKAQREPRNETQAEAEAEAEGKTNTPLPPRGRDGLPEVPIPLRTPEFLTAWDEWLAHRAEIKHKVTARAAKQQLAYCEQWGSFRAVAAIKNSIGGSYQKLVEPYPDKNWQGKKSPAVSDQQVREEKQRQAAAQRERDAAADEKRRRLEYVQALPSEERERLKAIVADRQPNDVMRMACSKADPLGGGRVTDLVYQESHAERLAGVTS